MSENGKIIRYFGGKGGVFIDTLLPYFPKSDIYIEPFGGSATMLLNQRTPIEIYNDMYENVYSLFKVISSIEMFPLFQRKCELAFFSEQLREESKKALKGDLSIIDRAFHYFYINRTSRNGVGGFCVNLSIRRGMAKSTSDFLSCVDGLEAFYQRLKSVIFMNRDALDIINEFDKKNVFFYLDPPYHHSTRGSTRYPCDMTDEKQAQFLGLIVKSNAKVLISGYDCEYYKVLEENGWWKESFAVKTVSADNKPKSKIETIWGNYEKPISSLF